MAIGVKVLLLVVALQFIDTAMLAGLFYARWW